MFAFKSHPLLGFALSLAIAAALLASISAGCYTTQKRTIETALAEIADMVQIGDSMSDAEARITAAGYKLLYPEAIDVTEEGEHLQQIVVLDEVHTGFLDSAFYTVTGGNNPLRPGSPYLKLIANMDGKIIQIGDATQAKDTT